MVKIFFSFLCMLSSIVFEIIEILLIIIIFSFVSDIFSCVFFWLDNVCRLFLIFLGMVRLVLMVVVLIFIVVILVGVIIKRVGIFGFDGLCLKVFSVV